MNINLVIPVICIIGIVAMLIKSIYDDRYKEGQIDAMNGEIKFILIELPDGTREYVNKRDLKGYEKYTIIEPPFNSLNKPTQ